MSFLSMNWFMLTIHWWLPRTLVEQKHIWDALRQWEWIMVSASTGGNARYYLLGAKLPLQPLTEVTLHANHPSHIWEIIWMPLALVAPKSAGRLGEAKGQFDKLARVWQHSALHPQQRIRIFQACVVSKLLYCLHTMWLNKAELRKIDGFQAKCLRSIFHIPPPYICKRSSSILKFRQLCLFQSIAMLPDDDVRRRCIFQPSSFIFKPVSSTPPGSPPNKYGFPKCIEWQRKLLKVLTC